MSDNPNFETKAGHGLWLGLYKFDPPAPGAVLVLKIGSLPDNALVEIRSDDPGSELSWDGTYGGGTLLDATCEALPVGPSDFQFSLEISGELKQPGPSGTITILPAFGG